MNTTTGAQRYNNRMDKIFEECMKAKEKYAMIDKATARPWKLNNERNRVLRSIASIENKQRHEVATTINLPDAELIVRAVNEYDESRRKIDSLVGALKMVREQMGGFNHYNETCKIVVKKALKLAEVSNQPV